MDTVTYPNILVRTELKKWVFAKVDILQNRQVAKAFGVAVVPIAIAITAEGKIIKRMAGFVAPFDFNNLLKETRKTRS